MNGNNTKEKPTSLSEDRPVNRSRLREHDSEWTILVVTWPSTTYELSGKFNRSGSSLKMSRVFCHQTEGRILPSFSEKWRNAGMGSPTEFLTLNTLESPKDGEESLLSDVLMEIGEVQQQYYLSEKACQGILQRAKKRGKTLPSLLKRALEKQSETKG